MGNGEGLHRLSHEQVTGVQRGRAASHRSSTVPENSCPPANNRKEDGVLDRQRDEGWHGLGELYLELEDGTGSGMGLGEWVGVARLRIANGPSKRPRDRRFDRSRAGSLTRDPLTPAKPVHESNGIRRLIE